MLATGMGRRRFVRGLAAGAFGVTAAWPAAGRPTSVSAGECAKPGRTCRRNKECCSRLCVRGTCRCKVSDECPDRENDYCSKKGRCIPWDGVCRASVDLCSGRFEGNCHPSSPFCQCFTSMESKAYCGRFGNGAACGGCTTSADCASFGAEAFCVNPQSEDLGCCNGRGICAVPCV